MPDPLTFEIVTPEAVQRFEGVEIVTLPGIMGQMGVLGRHYAAEGWTRAILRDR